MHKLSIIHKNTYNQNDKDTKGKIVREKVTFIHIQHQEKWT